MICNFFLIASSFPMHRIGKRREYKRRDTLVNFEERTYFFVISPLNLRHENSFSIHPWQWGNTFQKPAQHRWHFEISSVVHGAGRANIVTAQDGKIYVNSHEPETGSFLSFTKKVIDIKVIKLALIWIISNEPTPITHFQSKNSM